MNVFDVLGPIMIGPSSSHTAGAARLGLLARTLLGAEPVEADILLCGSFAKTYKGHGTDRALAAGILGMRPDDERLRDALEIAKEKGVNIQFTPGELPDAHPNTAQIVLKDASGRTASLVGASVGGGSIEVSEIDGMKVALSGEYFTVIIIHKDMPGAIADATDVLGRYDANICQFNLSRQSKGGQAVMALAIDSFNMDEVDSLCHDIEKLDSVFKCIPVRPIN